MRAAAQREWLRPERRLQHRIAAVAKQRRRRHYVAQRKEGLVTFGRQTVGYGAERAGMAESAAELPCEENAGHRVPD
jgi:hypothetical protein